MVILKIKLLFGNIHQCYKTNKRIFFVSPSLKLKDLRLKISKNQLYIRIPHPPKSFGKLYKKMIIF
jgi:hypothetical protein